jgi:hypothetical protein
VRRGTGGGTRCRGDTIGDPRYLRVVPHHRSLATLTLAVAALTLVATGCGSSGSSTASTSTTTASAVPTRAEPAGPNPSKSAKMVCAGEAQEDIAKALGVKAVAVTTPTWVDHVYSCKYVYPNGAITISVKELTDRATTTAYFNAVKQLLGVSPNPVKLAGGSFYAANGSIVVRKDYKVLTVDVSQLPAKFGRAQLKPSDVGANVAVTILGCWTGA